MLIFTVFMITITKEVEAGAPSTGGTCCLEYDWEYSHCHRYGICINKLGLGGEDDDDSDVGAEMNDSDGNSMF